MNSLRSRSGILATLVGLTGTLCGTPAPQMLTLQDCLTLALTGNRDLQIERINSEISRLQLFSAGSYYDPVLTGQFKREASSDEGGFDPADFSRNTFYHAESKTLQLGITGKLPTGMSYTLGGTHAQSDGDREGWNFASHRITAGLSFAQPLLRNAWTDQGRLTLQIQRRQVQIGRLSVERLSQLVVRNTEHAYYALAAAHAHRGVIQDLLRSRRAILDATDQKVRAGTATEADRLLVESRVTSAQATHSEAELSLKRAEVQLLSLLGEGFRERAVTSIAPRELLIVSAPVTPVSLQDSWMRGISQRPEIAAMAEEVAKAQMNTRFRRNQLFPTLDVVGGYGRKGSSTQQLPPPLIPHAPSGAAWRQLSTGDVPNDWIGLVFSVPLTRRAERGDYRISRQIQEQVQLIRERQEEQVLREIADALHAVENGAQRVKAARQAQESALAALAAEERKLAGGKSDLFLVLELQEDAATARALYVQAMMECQQALTELSWAEGSILQERQLHIDYR